MHHVFYGIAIFLQILQLFVITRCQCPEYFRYFRNETTGEIMGVVEIPTPPQGAPLYLRVILSVATVLPTKYVGRLELAKSREESIRSLLQGLPLYYRIYFPVRNPIPVVISITLNNAEFCSGQPPSGVIVTNIILEHTLYPPRVIIPLTEQLLNIFSNKTTSTTTLPTLDFLTDKNATVTPVESEETTSATATTTTIMTTATTATTTPATATTTTTTTTQTDVENIHPFAHKLINLSCGLTNGFPNSLIASQELMSTPIMWPWLAAIFFVGIQLEFQCTGNLITRQHVLTVAHCLIMDDDKIPPHMLLISLGRSNLNDWKEPGSANVGVAQYKFHPDYRNTRSSDSDLALVKLTELIEYTPVIRPICLWMGKIDLNNVVGKSGYVVGWESDGKSNIYSSEPHIWKVPIVSQEDCLRSNAAFIEITSNRTFCAGRRDGSGPCNGDSGSGLVMLHVSYGRYHLRGIVSSSILDVKKTSFDRHEYFVNVDIAKYLPWVRREIMS